MRYEHKKVFPGIFKFISTLFEKIKKKVFTGIFNISLCIYYLDTIIFK